VNFFKNVPNHFNVLKLAGIVLDILIILLDLLLLEFSAPGDITLP